MKCPKCGYLGFEDVDRCRNCGYEFSLTPSTQSLPELPMRTEAMNLSPLDDLTLIDAATAPPPDVPMSDAGPDLDRMLGAPTPEAEAIRSAPPGYGRTAPRAADELPLFGGPIPDDEPLITRASPPRTPLSVRRSTPDVGRLRPEQPRAQAFELSLDLDAPPAQTAPSYSPAARAAVEPWPEPAAERADTASIGTRVVAVAIDLLILIAVDLVVVYFTMQICGISVEELGLLPRGPLVAFLLVQNGGYLVAFTAGGQTLGKMATGIRVVGTESEGALDLGRAFTRTLVWVVLAVPAGLGFITMLGRDHRGLHDRFAGTRVVRASA